MARGGFMFRLILGFVLCNLATAAVVVVFLKKSHDDTRWQATMLADSFARILEQSISALELRVDVGLRDVCGYIEAMYPRGLDEVGVNAVIDRQFRLQPELDNLRFADETGRVLFGVGVPVEGSDKSVINRDFHARARGDPNGGLIVSKPIVGRAPGTRVLVMARRVNRPDGSFGGVVYADITMDTIQDLFGAVHLGPNGTVHLLRPDLEIVTRRPDYGGARSLVGQKFVEPGFLDAWQRDRISGVYVADSLADGMRRLNTYRRLGQYRGYVLVSLADEDIFAEWWRTFDIMMVMEAVVVGLTGLAARTLYAGWRRIDDMNRRLDHLARTDALTGCANRRQFLDGIEAERMRCERHGRVFSILSLDLDHFKGVNDRHGHLGGDAVLRRFVARVGNVLRATDILGRVGGEEFIVLLPETRLDDALSVAERIRLAVSSPPISLLTGSVALTVSIGVAAFHEAGDDTVERILSRADAALYAAKNGGRNQVRGEGDTQITPVAEFA